MRIACLKHVDYEGPAYFPRWASGNGHTLHEILVPLSGPPDPGDHDRVIVIGGPMSVWESDRHPWLLDEKRFLADLGGAAIPVLGICLGAQLLAEHLGARVAPGADKEIGWFPVSSNAAARRTWLGDTLPGRFTSFFWHGDYFDLPEGAICVAGSEAHGVQGFVHGRCLALQFHLEVTPSWAGRLVERDAHELAGGPFVQSATEITSVPDSLYDANHRLLDGIMARWMA